MVQQKNITCNREIVEREIARFCEQAKGGGPSIVAKCLALSDKRIKERLVSFLDNGYSFQGLECRQINGDNNRLAVRFQFMSTRDRFSLVPPTFHALVNVPASEVEEVLDDDEADTCNELPFSLAVPSVASKVIFSSETVEKVRRQEQTFFAKHGLADNYDPMMNSTTSVSFSQTQSNNNSDDTGNDDVDIDDEGN